MRDEDIRPELRRMLYRRHDDVKLFEELPLCRTGRADVAAVNCSLWGYEIKSECDNLNRLPGQISLYDQIFDYSLVVTTERHLRFVIRLVPSHWGLLSVVRSQEHIEFDLHREPQLNESTSPEALVRLLWKKEAVQVLRNQGIRIRAAALVSEVWQHLLSLPKDLLRSAVREALKLRASSAPVEP